MFNYFFNKRRISVLCWTYTFKPKRTYAWVWTNNIKNPKPCCTILNDSVKDMQLVKTLIFLPQVSLQILESFPHFPTSPLFCCLRSPNATLLEVIINTYWVLKCYTHFLLWVTPERTSKSIWKCIFKSCCFWIKIYSWFWQWAWVVDLRNQSRLNEVDKLNILFGTDVGKVSEIHSKLITSYSKVLMFRKLMYFSLHNYSAFSDKFLLGNAIFLNKKSKCGYHCGSHINSWILCCKYSALKYFCSIFPRIFTTI